MLASVSPFRNKHVIPGLMAQEVFALGMPQRPLVPQAGISVVDPGLLLLPEIDHPVQVSGIHIAVADRILHPESGRVPRPFLGMRRDADRLQAVGAVGPRLAIRPAPEPAARG